MEGLITFIVIIIVFNVLNRLIGAAKRKQQPPQRRSVIGPERTMPGRPQRSSFDDSAFFRSTRPKEDYDAYDDQEEEDKVENKQPETILESRKKVKKSGPEASASRNLRKLLSDKNSLVAAFIFHEAISAPPASSRKSKTVFSRQR